jgi:ankyrin repeat protein
MFMIKNASFLGDMSNKTMSSVEKQLSGSCADLFAAIRGEDVKCVEKLLDGGADPNFVNKDYETPLHYAAFKGRLDIVELLIRRGADVNRRTLVSRDSWEAGGNRATPQKPEQC